MTTTDARCVSVTGDQNRRPIVEDLMNCFHKYDMTHKKRGVAYIFNNENFEDPNLKPRHGSSKDTEDFKNALMKLGFEEDDINLYTDATIQEMLDALDLFGKENSDIDIDCFICAILSHGGSDDIIHGFDGPVELEKVLSCLRPDRCKLLTGIPKLFFIQACRGTTPDMGIEKNDADYIDHEERSPKIPIMADMLVVYSSCNKYPSFRDEKDGSWFMQALSKILTEYGTQCEILKLLTAVSNRVAALGFRSSANPEYNGCKQMPHIMSTLIKELKFEQKN
ncbi:caspase-7 [Octopus bimaculoides]|uniref:Caspase family p20 domain-containing protein n=1 Tax=Octopus bimaculoides TaxID=37653 RepID=A0A0L8H5C0_OCTBM|nr:caspase-7 [Octopus bimaculoides]|eukprot:XP_014775609.1 PREDICTED: caspase-3-like [Octopus bimaculoides]